MDLLSHNKAAWNRKVIAGSPYTIPVSAQAIAAARAGVWEIFVTPSKPVPKSWFPRLDGANVLGLAAGGAQQFPMLAAAGAIVTCFDLSSAQLEQERLIPEREGLNVGMIEGDMADLSILASESFDLIVNPVSNVFAPDVRVIRKEAARVLKRGGILISGFMNPAFTILDREFEVAGIAQLKYTIPYSDEEAMTETELAQSIRDGIPLEFGHSLADQIGGQLDAGLVLTGLYEDDWDFAKTPLSKHMNSFIATRAVKL